MDKQEFERLYRQAEELLDAGKWPQALELLHTLIAEHPEDPELLCAAAQALEGLGELALGSVYYGRAAAQLAAAGDTAGAREIEASYAELPRSCVDIFTAARDAGGRSAVLLADRKFETEGRPRELARAFAALGLETWYVEPPKMANINRLATEQELADFVFESEKRVEGVHVLIPPLLDKYWIDCYGVVASRLAASLSAPVVLAFTPAAYDLIAPFRGRGPILFDSSEPVMTEPKRWQRDNLIHLADAVLCAGEDGPAGAYLCPDGGAETDSLQALERSWMALAAHILRIAGGEEYPDERIPQDPETNVSALEPWECVGCLSCVETCPAGAITVTKDKLGFPYPHVDPALCTNCGLCLARCPARKPVPVGTSSSVCYEAIAQEVHRAPASSGGVFPVLAERVLSQGGAVCGAVFDANYDLHHVLSDDPKMVRRMYGSKYVASSTEGIYPAVRTMLEQGRTVLFSGCPCQTAGLSAFLGKDYPNLLLVSLVCHGTPPPDVWQNHLDSLKRPGDPITTVSFRDKASFGWDTGLMVEYSSGDRYVMPEVSDPYMLGFLSDLFLRDACYHCRFKSDTVSDLTLGDFWGIHWMMTPLDQNGVSYISVNSEKGFRTLQACGLAFRQLSQLPKALVLNINPPHRVSASEPPFRQELAELLPSKDLEHTYQRFFNRNHFDVALVLWFSENYGNALTNYALYRTVSTFLPRVLVVDRIMLYFHGETEAFARRNYLFSSSVFPAGLTRYMVSACDRFLVGSDQVWNPYYLKTHCNWTGYYHLDFVSDGKKKLSYGSSFGQAFQGLPPDRKETYSKLFRRFDAVSVREESGVDVLQNVFGVKGTQVLDPVFLLDRSEWEQFAAAAGITVEGRFLVAYLIDPTPEKVRYVKTLRNRLDSRMDIIFLINAGSVGVEEARKQFAPQDTVLNNLPPEVFAYYLAKSAYIVTDSFHGTCFSVIFEKPFIAFVNRQGDRFQIFRTFGVADRILPSVPETVSKDALCPIDYARVTSNMERMRKKSLDWLKRALEL